MSTLYTAFQETVRRHPDKTALVDPPTETTWSYVAVDGAAQQLIDGLSRHANVQPGQRVGLLLANQVEFVTGFLALAALGAIAVPLNTRLTADELRAITRDAGLVGLITALTFKPQYLPLAEHLGWLLLQEGDDPTASLPCETFDLNHWPEGDPPASLPPLAASDTAVLVYTSGTTGTPKGVMLSHGNLLADVAANIQGVAATEGDVLVTCSPLFHVFGLVNVLLTTLVCGASLVLVKRFQPRQVLEAIARYRVTFLAAVPTMYQMMLSALAHDTYDLRSIRVCHSGAAPMHTATLEAMEAAFGVPVQEGYGQSEASSIITANPLNGPRKPGSIGVPLSGITVVVVDAHGNPCPPGETGELRVQGPTVMQGYWHHPDATKQVLRDGWLYTGDMGFQDTDGYLFLVGRRDDMINTGGAKVYPREVEDVLYRFPAVARCAVKGEDSALYGQVVSAYVVPVDGQEIDVSALQRFCREVLAEYKIPKNIYRVTEIPRGASGKILRHQLMPPQKE